MTYDEAIRELSVQYLGDSDKMREAKDFAISVLKNDNWIPFDDDHKPEIGKEVIYSLKAVPEKNIPKRIGIDCYFPNDHEWWKENVRGWIPAPKPYELDVEEKKTTGHVHLESGKPLYLKTWIHKAVEMMEQEREKGSESMKDSV